MRRHRVELVRLDKVIKPVNVCLGERGEARWANRMHCQSESHTKTNLCVRRMLDGQRADNCVASDAKSLRNWSLHGQQGPRIVAIPRRSFALTNAAGSL